MRKYLMRFETVAVGAIGLFSALFFIQTYNYGRRAALFPRIISLLVLFLILVFIISRIHRVLKKKRASSKEEPVWAEGVAKVKKPQGVNWPLTFGGGIGFCILMYFIGFGLSTVCYMVTHTYLAGYRKHKIIFLYALALGVTMVLIGYAFMIPLPKGVLVEMISDRVRNFGR
jgi:hypothetical protein